MATVRTAAELLASARNYLDITWTDADGDEKLTGILSRGITYLDHISGVELDYADGTLARSLLFDYCRYARAEALEDFAANFQSELVRLHIDGEITQNATTTDTTA